MSRAHAFGVVPAAAGWLATAALAGEPLDWLSRMNDAVDGLNYAGTFVHFAGTESHTIEVVHRARGGEPAERVLVLDGEIREVIRTSRETRCIVPARKMVIVGGMGGASLRSTVPDYQGGIEDLYRIVHLGEELVSGRSARRIRVSPQDDYRFGYELWLDAETSLPLKTMTLSTDGHVVELVHFTDIRFPDRIADEQLAPTMLGEGFTTHQPPMLQGGDRGVHSGWTAARLPRGFRLSMAARDVTASGRPGEHLVYSDGLASVSVFIEQVGTSTAATTRFAHLGASNAFARVVGGYHIVVVGEVPADTVTLIGRSMQLRESADR